MVEALTGAAAVAVGITVGVLVNRARSRRVLRQAELEARQVADDARRVSELTIRESGAGGREQALDIQRTADAELQAYRQECELIAERVRKLEARSDRRARGLAEREAEIGERAEEVRARRVELKQEKRRCEQLASDFRSGLESRAGATGDAVRDQLIEGMLEETRSQCADHLRNLETSSAAEFTRMAKRIMSIAMQRYEGHCPRDRGSSLIPLTETERGKVSGENARNLDILAEIAGVELIDSDAGDALRIDTGDGMARELSRRSIARFLGEKKVKDPARLVQAIKKDLEREAVGHGNEAFKVLRLKKAAPEIVDLVGKLNWRTSYTQNQYRHSIEAAMLAGLMAAEIGLDLRMARRATLLHDIGKALTPLTEGSHALIGAEIARRCGEPEEVANAIGSHHSEEPMGSAYAWLATAADAMSGGRPGARREMAENYDERIGDLEKIASRFKGVHAVHAVQAGRELRVHVDEHQVRDKDLEGLCGDIAKTISDEMVFPGQIRVTVIREFRAVSLAC